MFLTLVLKAVQEDAMPHCVNSISLSTMRWCRFGETGSRESILRAVPTSTSLVSGLCFISWSFTPSTVRRMGMKEWAIAPLRGRLSAIHGAFGDPGWAQHSYFRPRGKVRKHRARRNDGFLYSLEACVS